MSTSSLILHPMVHSGLERETNQSFFIAVEAGSLAFAGVGESIDDARLDAARHRRALAETAARKPHSLPTAPLPPALRRWAADLLVFRLVDGQP